MSVDTGTSSAVGWINLTTLLLRRFASLESCCPSRFGDPKGGVLRMWSVNGFIVAVQHSSPRPGGERKPTWNGRSVWEPTKRPLRAPECLRQRGRGSSRPGPPPVSRTALSASFAAGRECPYPYTERPGSGCVNRMNRGRFPRVPVPSRSRIGVRQPAPPSPPANVKRDLARGFGWACRGRGA